MTLWPRLALILRELGSSLAQGMGRAGRRLPSHRLSSGTSALPASWSLPGQNSGALVMLYSDPQIVCPRLSAAWSLTSCSCVPWALSRWPAHGHPSPPLFPLPSPTPGTRSCCSPPTPSLQSLPMEAGQGSTWAGGHISLLVCTDLLGCLPSPICTALGGPRVLVGQALCCGPPTS